LKGAEQSLDVLAEDMESWPQAADTIENWQVAEAWVAAPQLSIKLQRDIDNNYFEFLPDDVVNPPEKDIN
jgi:hypothetical protein